MFNIPETELHNHETLISELTYRDGCVKHSDINTFIERL
jgi:hypothetical protein